jgi:hypothetical protein
MLSLRYLLTLLLLLSLSAFGVGCPSGDDDDSANDDDDTAGDDDDDDDDDGADDDDATGAPISCDGSLPVISESEPNDKVAQILAAAGEGFCIEGTVTCGSETYLDNDLYQFSLPEDRTVNTRLAWNGTSDLDSYMYIGGVSNNPLFGFEEGFSGPELGSADVVAGEDYLFQIACWDGQDTSYAFEVRYEALTSGDDDDSAGDDDDSAGDDDDATGDDDDATGDDDDSAVGDDDDSAVGDDDDSAVTCVAEIPGNSVDDDCDGATDEYTFSDVYSVVLVPNCSCHSGSSHSTGWFFNNNQAIAYTNLVNAAATEASIDRVEPGDAPDSYLMHKLDGTQGSVGGSGSQMPLGGSALSAAVREGVRGWINTGAAND